MITLEKSAQIMGKVQCTRNTLSIEPWYIK